MSEREWWLGSPASELSQGDILAVLPQGHLGHPVTHLRHASMKHGVDGWMESPTPVVGRDQRLRMMAVGREVHALVLSHSCEIDKGKGRILVAPIAPISTVGEAQREAILGLRSFAQFPLPDVPSLGDCYADLRSVSALPSEAVKSADRLGSMSDEALTLLHARLFGFFTRLQFPPV